MLMWVVGKDEGKQVKHDYIGKALSHPEMSVCYIQLTISVCFTGSVITIFVETADLNFRAESDCSLENSGVVFR